MPLNRYVGTEPIRVDAARPNTKEELELFVVTAGTYTWRPKGNTRVRIKSICIDLTTVLGGAGRYPYIQHTRRFPSSVGAPAAGWYTATNATPAASSGHYTFACGLSPTYVAVGGTIPIQTEALPDEMYLNSTDFLLFVIDSFAAGDSWVLKIIYDVIGE